MKKLLFLIILFTYTIAGFSQKAPSRGKTADGFIRCDFVENEKHLKNIDSNRETKEQFELWIANKIDEIKKDKTNRNANSPAVVINIPVVIHVISNGDAIGAGENITDAKALSQITVLNQDFRRMMGTPGFNDSPVGADMEINFVMAARKPDNITSTNGIDRVTRTLAQYATRDQTQTMKTATQWDPTRYFNMWTVYFSDVATDQMNGVLGYAQFPSSSSLSGLNTNGGSASTDGLVVDYRCFGSSALASGSYFNNYNRGRTTSHEIGHCFGLRHIWGDGNGDEAAGLTDCTASDFCADTPQAGYEHYTCGNFDTCPEIAGSDMVQNYMDYTNDACMNIFTLDQKSRVQAVLTNSPRRNTLATSNAATPLNIESYNINNFYIFPNPAKDIIGIALQTAVDRYEIFNNLGQRIASNSVQNDLEFTINVTQYSVGIYYIKVYKDNETKTQKFIKN